MFANNEKFSEERCVDDTSRVKYLLEIDNCTIIVTLVFVDTLSYQCV